MFKRGHYKFAHTYANLFTALAQKGILKSNRQVIFDEEDYLSDEYQIFKQSFWAKLLDGRVGLDLINTEFNVCDKEYVFIKATTDDGLQGIVNLADSFSTVIPIKYLDIQVIAQDNVVIICEKRSHDGTHILKDLYFADGTLLLENAAEISIAETQTKFDYVNNFDDKCLIKDIKYSLNLLPTVIDSISITKQFNIYEYEYLADFVQNNDVNFELEVVHRYDNSGRYSLKDNIDLAAYYFQKQKNNHHVNPTIDVRILVKMEDLNPQVLASKFAQEQKKTKVDFYTPSLFEKFLTKEC